MRILLGWRSKLYRFLTVESAERDGSLSIAIHQKQQTHQITLHQSGRINFKGVGKAIYIEPLVTMTQPFGFYRYRIPTPSALDEFKKKRNADDTLLEVSDGDNPISFVFVISPKGRLPDFSGSVSLTYVDSYTFVAAIDPTQLTVEPRHEKDFARRWAAKGLFNHQQIPEEIALVQFHKVKFKTHGAILYEPNGAGEWMLVFTTAMRIAPRVSIEMADPSLHVTDQDIQRDPRSERVMMRFKVRNKTTRQIIKKPAAIRSIALDSEL